MARHIRKDAQDETTIHDRDHDGRDDRVEGEHRTTAASVTHDRDRDGVDDRLEHGDRRTTAVPVTHDRDHDGVDDRREHREHYIAEDRLTGEEEAREKFGGLNLGACFFGWLVAIALAILLTSIVGAIATAIGSNASITQTEAERQAGTIGIVAAAVLLAVLMIGYYAGGYVAGRMSRFDGARQGFGVWLIGFVVTILAVVLGAVFGSQYNLLDRVSLPRIPLPTDQIGWGALIAAAAVIVGTLLAALVGGKVGNRYHHRVDRVAHR